MKGKKGKNAKPKALSKPLDQAGDASLQPSGEVVLSHQETAAKAPTGKQIHPRRPLPLVPEGESQRGSQTQEEAQGSRRKTPERPDE